MAEYSKQHRNIATGTDGEAVANAGLTTRLVLDTALSINNAKAHALASKLVMDCAIPDTKYQSADASTTETVIQVYAPRHVPDGYNFLWWTILGKNDGASGNVTWRLYCCDTLYLGAAALDTSKLGNYLVDSQTITGTSYQRKTSRGLGIVRSALDDVWLVLTASNPDTSTRGKILTLDVTPMIYS